MRTTKYTIEDLESAVAESYSVMEVMRKLGLKMAGGSHSHLSRKIRKLNIDTAHFTGQVHNKGKVANNRLTTAQVLVLLPEGSPRTRHSQLKRAMLDSGVEYECAKCFLVDWNDLPIVLEVDHVNGEWLDNRIENLRFLCPNCHSQCTDTNRSWKNNGM